MARNVEIKARVGDPDALRERVEAVADSGPCTVVQRDTFFHSRQGRLKLREMSTGTAELIYYDRADRFEPVESSFVKIACHEPEAVRQALACALGVRGEVSKKRLIYLCGPTRIHLDRVQGLGTFAELEVVLSAGDSVGEGVSAAYSLMERLGIERRDLIEESYIDLLEKGNEGPG